MESTVKTGEFIEVTGGSVVVLSPASSEPAAAPVPIGPEPCIVGRGSHCQVIVNDARVSTSHCQLTATDTGVLLVDLDSTNGTYVNQVRLQRGAGVYLPVDSRIRVG